MAGRIPSEALATSPRVSVCIPTIDRPELLREAIKSVVAQTWTDLEIVVGDNSANEDAQKRIDAVLAEFPGINLVLRRHPCRLEAAQSFNSLIDAARGEFWVCLPDDDLLCPNFLSRSIEALDAHPECAFTFGDHWIIRAEGTRDEAASRSNSILFGRHLLREGPYPHDRLFGIALKQSMCLQTTVFRRSVVAAFRFTPGIMLLDQYFFLRLGLSADTWGAYYIDERVFEYRIHGAQITSITRREAMIRDQIAVLESMNGAPSQYVPEIRGLLSAEYLALAFIEAEEGKPRSARANALKSIRLAVGLRGALGALLVTAAPAAVPLARRLYRRISELLASAGGR